MSLYNNRSAGAWLATTGSVCYGAAIAGIGLMHFLYTGLRPLILPVPADLMRHYNFVVYIFGAYLSVSGILIVAGKKTYATTLLLGIVLLLFLVSGHLPFYLLDHPEIRPRLINTLKLLALSGGAFMVSQIFHDRSTGQVQKYFHKLTKLGSYFFAVMLIVFGTGHLINPTTVSALVPGYIPFPVFWTILSGVALTASGLCIFFKYQWRKVSILLAIMLFLWLPMLHLYYAFRFPKFQDGENIIGSLQCLAFCGMALITSQLPQTKTKV